MTTPAAPAPVTGISPLQAPGPPTVGQDGCPIRAFAFSSGGIGTARHLGVAHALLVIQGKLPAREAGPTRGLLAALPYHTCCSRGILMASHARWKG
jgi:hypothetical protein